MSQPVPAAATAESPDLAAARSRKRLFLAVGIAAVWWSALASLALFTANPVTVNREQIERAEFVVTALVDAEGSESITVERTWKGPLGIRAGRGEEPGSERVRERGGVTCFRWFATVTGSKFYDRRCRTVVR